MPIYGHARGIPYQIKSLFPKCTHLVARSNSHQTNGLRPYFIGLQPCPVSMMSQGDEYEWWAFWRLYKESLRGFSTQNC